MKDLDKLKTDITDAPSTGKINELHYNSLKDEISILYEEIFKKRIESLNSNNNKDFQKKIHELRKNTKDAYSKGILTDLHYNLLNEEISQREKDKE